MKRDVLGASQPPLPLGRKLRNGGTGPIVNEATYNPRLRLVSCPILLSQRQPANALDVNGIKLIGPLPRENDDGFVGHYDVSEYAIFYYPTKRDIDPKSYRTTQRKKTARAPRAGRYTVFFVNGMSGNPAKFRAQACATAAVSGGPVTGVFNAGENFGADLLQCLTDKLFSNDWLNLKVEAWKLLGSPSQSEIDKYVYQQLRDSNLAAASLYRELLQTSGEKRIVAHSQGNIIMCNAVNGVYAARGAEGIKDIRLYAVASPVVFWSNAKSCLKRGAELSFANDLVTWLGFNWGDESYLAGWSATGNLGQTEITEEYSSSLMTKWHLATHQFYIYLEKYWQLLQRHFE